MIVVTDEPAVVEPQTLQISNVPVDVKNILYTGLFKQIVDILSAYDELDVVFLGVKLPLPDLAVKISRLRSRDQSPKFVVEQPAFFLLSHAFRLNVMIFATSSGWLLDQNEPSFVRKVGIPASALVPAPVKRMILFGCINPMRWVRVIDEAEEALCIVTMAT